MFNSISGEVTYKDELRIFLQTGGLEWEISTSRISSSLFPEEGEKARAFVYLHHREDQLRLYGFATLDERDIFLDLLRVQGIGPRQALKILSGIEFNSLVEALEAEDLETLASLPGLGRKTAQKILLKLKGKLTVSLPKTASVGEELIEALAGMGFDRRVAANAVKSSLKEFRDSTLSKEDLERELFKKAIALASSRESRA